MTSGMSLFAGGIATIANVICKSINQPMVMLEACRVLLCLLALTTRPQAERSAAVQALHDAAAAAAAASGAVPDENGEIPGAEPDAEELANAAYGEGCVWGFGTNALWFEASLCMVKW